MSILMKLALKAVVYTVVSILGFGVVVGGLVLAMKLVGPPVFFAAFIFGAVAVFWLAILIDEADEEP